jgi:hypothetical protein
MITADTMTRVLAALRKIENASADATPKEIGAMRAEAKIARIYIEVDLGRIEVQS